MAIFISNEQVQGSAVLLVGHCSFDSPKLQKLVERAGALKVDGVATAFEAFERLGRNPYALVLVNREFDSDGDFGIEFIRKASSQYSAVRFMLISNYSDAQQAAVAAGGSKGFGKNALDAQSTQDLIAGALRKESTDVG